MRTIIRKNLFAALLLVFLFNNFAKGQALEKEPILGCENVERWIQLSAHKLEKYYENIYDAQLTAINNITRELAKEDLPNIDFNGDELFGKSIVRTGLVIGERIYETTLKETPVLSTVFEIVSDGIDAAESHKSRVSEYKRMKSENLILDILNNLSNEIIQKKFENYQGNYCSEINKKYRSTPLKPEFFREKLEKELDGLKKPSPEFFELNCYQAILEAMYSNSQKGDGELIGYIDVRSNLDQYDLETLKMDMLKNYIPRMVSFDLVVGNKKLGDKLENIINDLIRSGKSGYNSILELKGIPRHLTAYVDLQQPAVSVSPIIHIRGKKILRWSESDPSIVCFVHHGNNQDGTLGKLKYHFELNVNKVNRAGEKYSSLIQLPFDYIFFLSRGKERYRFFQKYN